MSQLLEARGAPPPLDVRAPTKVETLTFGVG